MKIFATIFLTLTIGLPLISWAKEELIIVQTVSKDRRSFVLQKGIKDGYAKGQELIFSNDNASIVCKAIEVNRDYSLWVPLDRNLNIPFNKQDVIAYNTHVFGNVGVEVGGEIINLIPDDKFNKEYSHLRNENLLTIKYSYGAAVSQSASSVSSAAYSKKKGQDFALEYGIRFTPSFELGIGGRYDYENYRLTTPELDIPTSRYILTTSFTYHFLSLSENKNNFYATVTLGLGKSSTTVDSVVNSGLTTILPQVRIGYLVPISKTMALIVEASVESISSHEKNPDGINQDSSQVNSKVSIGLKF